MKEIVLTIKNEEGRIDKFLSEYFVDYTRSFLQSLIKSGGVLVNDEKVKPSYGIKEKDRILVKLPEGDMYSINPEDKKLSIVYEDEYMAVINKPYDLIVHPTQSVTSGTLVNRMLYHFDSLSDIYEPFRPGIVHRLDKDTTGLIVIAKNNEVHEKLSKAFKNREVEKKYVALVHGMINEEITVEEPIGRDTYNRTKMAVVPSGKFAKSIVKPLDFNEDYSMVEVDIYTGRTHQIRVHLSYLHHPVLGDKTYGLKKEKIKADRQMLHAYCLRLNHPIHGYKMEFKAPLYDDFITISQKCNLSLEQFNLNYERGDMNG